MSSNHRAMCVSCRSGGETVRVLSCGLLWILITRLQRSRTFPWVMTSALCTTQIFLTLRPTSSLTFPFPACNCDPMGSVSMQCDSNGSCHCRQGFVGSKCDKCELNYFHNRATHQCDECPACYGLVKKQVSSQLFVWKINSWRNKTRNFKGLFPRVFNNSDQLNC